MSKDLKIKLCKPDRTVIHHLNDIISPRYKEIYNGINTLSFEIPYYLNKYTGERYKNPVIDLIKPYYLLFNNNEYFIIDVPTHSSDSEKDVLRIQAYGLGYQLTNKRIRNLVTGTIEIPVKQLADTLDIILNNTGWSVGTIDVQIGELYRAINIADSTVLESLNTICGIWDCIAKYDTVNKTIDFVDYKEDGGFNGLVISQARYLKSIETDKLSDLTTKLHVYGVNDLSINEVTSNGQNFITDYSFVKNIDYMTQTMIDHLELYEDALNDNDLVFSGYLTTKLGYQATLSTKMNELDNLVNETTVGKIALEGLLDIAIANGNSTTQLVADLAARQVLINTKGAEITAVNNQIIAVDVQISTFQSDLDISNYLSPAEISLLNELTFESSFVDTNITAKGNTITILKELKTAAEAQLLLLSTPRFSARINLIDFLECEGVDYDKERLKIGNIIKIRHPDLDMYLDVKIVEIERDFDGLNLNIVVANIKSLVDGFTKGQSLLQSVSSTNGILSVNANSWSAGGTAGGIINDYISSAIDTTKQTILSGVDDSVQINNRGITIADKTGQYVQRFTAGAWGLSSDYGENFKIGAAKGIIYADTVVGSLIVGQEGSFEGISIYNGAAEVCRIGNFISQNPDTLGASINGIQIQGGALEILGTGIGDVQFDTDYGGVFLGETTGIQVLSGLGASRTKTVMNATDGFYIKKSTDGGVTYPTTLFSVDTAGNASFKGSITGATGTFTGSITGATGTFAGVVNASDYRIGGVSILTDGKIDGGYIDNIDAGTISGDVITITDRLVLSNSTFSGGIRWGTAAFATAIYKDPAGGALTIYNNGSPIYAGTQRIDIAPVARFG